jgi:hypothetical protein
LHDEATWDDITYELYAKKKLAVAREAVNEGRVAAPDAVRSAALRD